MKASDIVLDPNVDVAVDVDDINNELARISALLYRYGILLNEASKASSLLEAKLKATKGDRLLEIKRDPSLKTTEATAEAMVNVTPRVIEALELYQEKKREAGDLDSILSALRAKKDTLITLSYNLRSENK
jgi:hypothetical protein